MLNLINNKYYSFKEVVILIQLIYRLHYSDVTVIHVAHPAFFILLMDVANHIRFYHVFYGSSQHNAPS